MVQKEVLSSEKRMAGGQRQKMEKETKTILIAEDEDDLREMYTMALAAMGFEVLQSVNGQEALDLLEKKQEQVDLILLDIIMPVLDGIATLEKIKKNERINKIPVVVSTNLDNEEDRKDVFNLGAREYLVKSKHTPSELAAKIFLIANEQM
ncbi:MAG: response regulator [Candidatus Moranbacteria bacterium]|nr:response regulator [Candidatus Moranbacteria bacterium]